MSEHPFDIAKDAIKRLERAFNWKIDSWRYRWNGPELHLIMHIEEAAKEAGQG